jgi:osmotically-inducible protein OsmY
MDERDRDWRVRDWRRTEAYGRGGEDRGRGGETSRWGEDRTWSGPADDDRGPYQRADRDRSSYGEESEDYGGRSGLTAGGGAYGAGGSYGGGEGYGRASGRPQAYQSGAGQGRSGGLRVSSQDYTGRNYADEAGRPDYGGQGRGSYAGDRYTGWGERDEGRYGYDSDRGERRSWSAGEDRSYDRYGAEMRRRASASYGAQGDEYERRGGQDWDERRERDRGEGGGDFLQRAGERISSWFRGDNLMRGSREEDDGGARLYQADYGREARWEVRDRGHRGIGPKGYRRSDERINEEVHERLTDDPWLDASNIEVEVKDGEVTLTGHVDNREAKHRAERLVEDLSGVRHVQNNLRVNPDAGLTGAGRGYGSSALEAEMRRNALGEDPSNQGASGLSGRTSTGAAAERSTGTATETSVDPKSGVKR